MPTRPDMSALLMGILADARTANNASEPGVMAQYSPYPQFNPTNPNFSDRRNDPWPVYPGITAEEYAGANTKYTPTPEAIQAMSRPWTNDTPPDTPLANQLGLQDIIKMQQLQQLLNVGHM